MAISPHLSLSTAALPRASAQAVIQSLQNNAVSTGVETLRRFFKTGKGQYGEGGFLGGLYVPVIRCIS